MPNSKKLDEDAPSLETLTTDILNEMDEKGPLSDDYPGLLAYLERIHEVKAKERRNPVSLDTIALVAGNLLGILIIVAYEQKHVITSKGLPQLIRPR
jgi:hypothetical protein